MGIRLVFKLRGRINFKRIEFYSVFFNRIIMGYDLWIWWMRSLSFIIVNPFLGPHLVSIGKMVGLMNKKYFEYI